MTVTVYGIPNCDTIRKARQWLDAHGIAYVFHDYKKAGIERAKLDAWADKAGWEMLLNRAGTTFRQLSETEKSDIDRRKAIRLMLAQPSMIKRPVVERGNALMVGFDLARYTQFFRRS